MPLVSTLPGVLAEIAAIVGCEATAEKIGRGMAGRRAKFPTIKAIESTKRKAAILKGHASSVNPEELAERHGVSLVHVYRILRQARKQDAGIET
ncbi:MAG: Mor transcription activator family protein [Pseudomonadota bacterium]